MGAGFNDWIHIQPTPMGIDSYPEELDRRVQVKLAEQIGTRLRTRLDPGIDPKAANRAQAVRSRVDGNRIVIDSRDQLDAVTRAGDNDDSGSDGRGLDVEDIDDLFNLSSGVPQIDTDPDGNERLVFRRVSSMEKLGLPEDEQDRIVDQAVTEVLQGGIVEAFEEASQGVEDEHPAERVKR